jgi:hypothetical protein
VCSLHTNLLMVGENINGIGELRSATVAKYLGEVNKLHKFRKVPQPINLKNNRLKPSVLYNNLHKEETIARRPEPLTTATARRIISESKDSPYTSKKSLLKDIAIVAQEVGPRAAEIIQTTETKPDYHKYPSGRRVLKSLSVKNLTFFDKQGRPVKDLENMGDVIDSMEIEWEIQINRRNGEKLKYKSNAVV